MFEETLNKVMNEFMALILPVILLASTGFVFLLFRKKLGEKGGYFFGFLFYWLFWCLLVPKIFLSENEIRSLFSFDLSAFMNKPVINSLCLIIPLILAYGYAIPKAIRYATFKVVVVSLLISLVNAPLEELLWRGLYLKLLGDHQLLFLFYSSFGFAIWHFAPQAIFPNKAPGGQWSFVWVAFILGILYSIVAMSTSSILFTSVSHFLFDFSGLGGKIYFKKS